MTFLLDVNVLVAFIDRDHVHHGAAHRWFAAEGSAAFATCPITEIGVLRIMSGSGYPNAAASPSVVAKALATILALPGHAFWPDDITLLDDHRVDVARLLKSAQVTDTYLLALAVAHGGQLATLDRRLVVDAVPGGRQALRLIL